MITVKYKHNNKAFTLIELLGIITILGVIGLIITPAVDSALKKQKERALDTEKDQIIVAAKNWASDNKLVVSGNNETSITIGELKQNGYLDYELRNPKNNKCLSNDNKLLITKNGNAFNYDFDGDLIDGTDDDCGTIKSTSKASIYLLGDDPYYMDLNVDYVEPGFIAKDNNGNNINDNVTITNNIDKTKSGKYNVKYCVTVDGVIKSKIRTVIVNGGADPIITVPSPTYIDISDKSFNLLQDVKITDNSGEVQNPTVKGTIKYGTKGTYTLTYIYTDLNGRSATANRDVIIKDIKEPTINSPKTTYLDITEASYDLLKDISIIDNSGESITPTISGTVGFGVKGTYPITYTATDSTGNTSSLTRNIIVNDLKKPVIEGIDSTVIDITVDSFDLMDPDDIVVTDNSGEDITPTVTGEIKYGVRGKYLITYIATDSSGNTATFNREICVDDIQRPEISGPTTTKITTDVKIFDVMEGITVNDNSGEEITPVVTGNLSLGIEGTYTLTYTATDSSGNSKTFERKIIITNPTIDNSPHVGYYADIDGDNIPDGVIFADLVSGAIGSGKWGNDSNSTYTIPTISENSAKKYYISNESYTGDFGTKPVLSQVSNTTGSNRFYIMALNDVSTQGYCWYKTANGQMSDYATYTSVNFGSGSENTSKMITKWDAAGYGAQTTTGTYIDIWGAIKLEVAKSWFVPSREEFAAFANELGITAYNYTSFKLKGYYWSSSQRSEYFAWYVLLGNGYMGTTNVNYYEFFRLAATF